MKIQSDRIKWSHRIYFQSEALPFTHFPCSYILHNSNQKQVWFRSRNVMAPPRQLIRQNQNDRPRNHERYGSWRQSSCWICRGIEDTGAFLASYGRCFQNFNWKSRNLRCMGGSFNVNFWTFPGHLHLNHGWWWWGSPTKTCCSYRSMTNLYSCIPHIWNSCFQRACSDQGIPLEMNHWLCKKTWFLRLFHLFLFQPVQVLIEKLFCYPNVTCIF